MVAAPLQIAGRRSMLDIGAEPGYNGCEKKKPGGFGGAIEARAEGATDTPALTFYHCGSSVVTGRRAFVLHREGRRFPYTDTRGHFGARASCSWAVCTMRFSPHMKSRRGAG